MRNKYGGQVIGAGGYGCVFKPALKCQESNIRTTGISKMLSNKDANVEWKEISNVKKIILKIQDNHKYFLLGDMNICKPNILTEDDKKNMQICNPLNNIGINAKNINSKLDRVQIINMPDGGKDINEIISKNLVKFDILNASLIDLLKNGIIPMNELKLFHNDLKGENILYKDEQSRIIDWGLASIQSGNKIPSVIKNRVMQFNLPFSNILFNSYFNKWYSEQLNINNVNKNNPFIMEQLELIAINWFELWKDLAGDGHIEYINNYIIIPIFLNYGIKVNMRKPDNIILLFVSKYLARIFYEYTNFNTLVPVFEEEKYYNEVYKNNCDIWGFVMSYMPLIRNNYFQKQNKNAYEVKYYIKNICDLLLKYCFNNYYSTRKINIKELVKDLENIQSIEYNILNNNEVVDILSSHSNNPLPINPLSNKPLSNNIREVKKTSKKQKTEKKIRLSNKSSNKKISEKKLSEKKLSNNLSNKLSKHSSQKKKSTTKKRKRCPNGSRKNKNGDCIPYK